MRKNILKNSQGGMLLMVTVVASLAGVLAVVGSTGLTSVFKSYASEKAVTNRQVALTTVETTFADRRFCNAFFHSGYNTNPGVFDFNDAQIQSTSTAHANWIKSRVNLAQNNFKDFKLKSIELRNPTDIGSAKPGQRVKQFDVAMTIQKNQAEPNGSFVTKTFGHLDATDKDISEKTFLVVSENQECYLRKGATDLAASGLKANAIQIACSSLGGSMVNSRCYTKEYQVDSLGIPKFSAAPITDNASLADAFCSMETNILKKGKIDSGSGKSDLAAWSTLCPKPVWTGCRAVDSVGTRMILPNEVSNMRPKTIHQKDVERYVKPFIQNTLDKRVARIMLAREGIHQRVSISDTSRDMKRAMIIGAVLGGLGGVLIAALLPRCNNAKIYISRTCRNGYLETDKVVIKREKPKLFGCKSAGKKTIQTKSDAIIIAELGAGGLPSLLDLTSDETESEIESAYEEDLEAAESSSSGGGQAPAAPHH